MPKKMCISDGMELVGNQVGLLKRLAVTDVFGNSDKPEPMKLPEPKISKKNRF